ncbi:MAG TPA: hypothetical protein VGO22_08490, partial [Pseudorhizobium sp.]|nr:hypothetical protein [Pseudorhizobium sp.]
HVEAGPAGPKVEPTGWVGGITTQPLRSGRFLYTGWGMKRILSRPLIPFGTVAASALRLVQS